MAQLVHAIAPDAELYFATPYEKIGLNQTQTKYQIQKKLLNQHNEWAAGMKTQITELAR